MWIRQVRRDGCRLLVDTPAPRPRRSRQKSRPGSADCLRKAVHRRRASRAQKEHSKGIRIRLKVETTTTTTTTTTATTRLRICRQVARINNKIEIQRQGALNNGKNKLKRHLRVVARSKHVEKCSKQRSTLLHLC